MGKHKSKPVPDEYYTGSNPIRGCPFCGSDNIVVGMPTPMEGVSPNMTLICLHCHTKYVLDMICNEDNIIDAFRFWNHRFEEE